MSTQLITERQKDLSEDTALLSVISRIYRNYYIRIMNENELK